MKFLTSMLLIFSSFYLNAQTTIRFTYDTAGNQTMRQYICVNCLKTAPAEPVKDLETTILNQISYYPNPVKEELHVQWPVEENKYVETITVSNMNGQVLQSYRDLKQNTTITIPFLNFPSGLFVVTLIYNNGEIKTLKIIKN